MFSDELTEAAFEERITSDLLISAIRKATLTRELTPVLMGSAYKNKGVQPLLNAINRLLPSPFEVKNLAIDLEDEDKEIVLSSDADLPLISLVFKLEDGPYGQLTYIRVYQGILAKGNTLVNVRTGKKVKIGRVIRMHADQMEDIEKIPAGYIGALFGIDCTSGDTLVTPGIRVSMTSMHVPDPVISLAITPEDYKSEIGMSKALERFTKEDPTFKTHHNDETDETIISGMGELHLEVYIERMRREFDATVFTGAPQVAYKETITCRVEFNYTHKKQTGGAGQFGRVAGYMEPVSNKEFVFENRIVGGAIPTPYISGCEKGFKNVFQKGPLQNFRSPELKLSSTTVSHMLLILLIWRFRPLAGGPFFKDMPKPDRSFLNRL